MCTYLCNEPKGTSFVALLRNSQHDETGLLRKCNKKSGRHERKTKKKAMQDRSRATEESQFSESSLSCSTAVVWMLPAGREWQRHAPHWECFVTTFTLMHNIPATNCWSVELHLACPPWHSAWPHRRWVVTVLYCDFSLRKKRCPSSHMTTETR